MHLFVYGTLKREQSRHRFLRGQDFVAPARTQPLFRMYNVGSFPALVRSTAGLAIEGELWTVDDACLQILDRVEGLDTGLYSRQPIALAPPYDGWNVIAYIYERSVEGLPDCGTCWRLA